MIFYVFAETRYISLIWSYLEYLRSTLQINPPETQIGYRIRSRLL